MNHVTRLTPWYTVWAFLNVLPLAEQDDAACRQNPILAIIRQNATLALCYVDDVAWWLAREMADRAQAHRDMAIAIGDQAVDEMVQHADAWLDDEPTYH